MKNRLFFRHVKLFYYTQDPEINPLDLSYSVPLHIGDATSISKVSESVGHRYKLERRERKNMGGICAQRSPKCPGLASGSLCIRESRVRGDIGNRSLVFPEFVLKNRKENIL